MTTPMISEQWPRFVLPIVRREWFQKMTAVNSNVGRLFGIENSNSASEFSQGIGEFGLVPEYNSSDINGNGNAIQYDTFNPLFEKTFTHKEYAKGVAIERKLWDDDRAGLIKRRARTLGIAFGTTIATHQASVFNNAFSSSVLGADGKPLCATDHPNRPNDLTTVTSNKGTSPLSYDAIVETLQAGKRMVDDRGNPFPVMYDTLVVPIELEAKAYEYVAALKKPGTSNNDANFLYSQGLTVLVENYLASPNNWFMVDSNMAVEHLLWFWRVRPELTLDPASDFNLVARYRGYMRYSFGWDDYRWVFGHEVA